MKALFPDFGGVISRTVFETYADNEAAPGLLAETLTWRGPFGSQNDVLWQSKQAGEISEHHPSRYHAAGLKLCQGAEPADHKQFGAPPCAMPIF
jgi:hypothetical protein